MAIANESMKQVHSDSVHQTVHSCHFAVLGLCAIFASGFTWKRRGPAVPLLVSECFPGGTGETIRRPAGPLSADGTAETEIFAVKQTLRYSEYGQLDGAINANLSP
jgi:hypothetical protein